MNKALSKYLESFVDKRCEEILNTLVDKDWYVSNQDYIIHIKKDIQKVCGKEAVDLIKKIDYASYEIHSNTYKEIYVQAFNDAISFISSDT